MCGSAPKQSIHVRFLSHNFINFETVICLSCFCVKVWSSSFRAAVTMDLSKLASVNNARHHHLWIDAVTMQWLLMLRTGCSFRWFYPSAQQRRAWTRVDRGTSNVRLLVNHVQIIDTIYILACVGTKHTYVHHTHTQTHAVRTSASSLLLRIGAALVWHCTEIAILIFECLYCCWACDYFCYDCKVTR